MTVQENTSLLSYNTFGIDIKADYFIEYDSLKELKEALSSDIVKSNPILPIGEGSNLLFLSDFKGVVLHSNIQFVNIIEENSHEVIIEAGAGINWDEFVAYCVNKEWYGVENLSLIPGQIGAASVQNIGAYGTEIKDVIYNVHAIEINNNSEVVFSKNECHYAYRDSIFKNRYKGRYIITSAVFRLSKIPVFNFEYQHLESAVRKKGEITIKNVRDTIIEIREDKLPNPKLQGNGGSFFKNPIISKQHFSELLKHYPDLSHFFVSDNEEKISAAWLIDKCGWKGKQIGNAGVHDKQPLVLINLGEASGKEIEHLATQIQLSVKEKFGVDLNPEVNYINYIS